MTTLLDHLETRPPRPPPSRPRPPSGSAPPWPPSGSRSPGSASQKTLTPEQKAQAAEAFDAEGQFLSAAKKLLDTKHSAFRAVTAIRGKIDALLEGADPAVPRARRPADQAGRRSRRSPPDGRLPGRAGRRRGQPRPPLRRAEAGRRASGSASLYNAVGLSRDAGRPLRRRVRLPQRRAARLPGPALAGALRAGAGPGGGPVRGGRAAGRAGVPRRVRPARRPPHRADLRRGRRRQPRSSATRPSATSSSSSPGSASSTSARTTSSTPWSSEAQRAVRGVGAQDLRDSGALRQRVATELSRVQTSLDALLVERPRRRILRQAPAPGGA